MTTARLDHLSTGYVVVHDGRILIFRSRDPETDAARALKAMNRTGVLYLFGGLPGGETGKPRTIINIEKASKLTVEEGPHGPHFVKLRSQVEQPHGSEDVSGGVDHSASSQPAVRAVGDVKKLSTVVDSSKLLH
jgi:hypothetical protein